MRSRLFDSACIAIGSSLFSTLFLIVVAILNLGLHENEIKYLFPICSASCRNRPIDRHFELVKKSSSHNGKGQKCSCLIGDSGEKREKRYDRRRVAA